MMNTKGIGALCCALALSVMACTMPSSGAGVQNPLLSEISILVSSTRTYSSQHGFSLASSADGSVLITGAPYEDGGAISDSGVAKVFRAEDGLWTQALLMADDAAANDWFGHAVAVSADGLTAAVGARYDDTNGTDSGSIYIFIWNGSDWFQAKKIMPNIGKSDDYFGSAIALNADGSRLIVGATGYDEIGKSNMGIAYYFSTESQWDSYSEIVLSANDAVASHSFGKSVAIDASGKRVVVGAIGDGNKGELAGSAYVYDLSETIWTEAKLYAPDGNEGDKFGYSVALNGVGNRLIIGAFGGDGTVATTGAAYMFSWDESSWNGTKLLLDQPLDKDDYLGVSVAISGDGKTALIGASGDDQNGISTGCAYLLQYLGDSWLKTIIRASDPESPDAFGNAVAINDAGTKYIISAPLTDNRRGSVYLYVWQ